MLWSKNLCSATSTAITVHTFIVSPWRSYRMPCFINAVLTMSHACGCKEKLLILKHFQYNHNVAFLCEYLIFYKGRKLVCVCTLNRQYVCVCVCACFSLPGFMLLWRPLRSTRCSCVLFAGFLLSCRIRGRAEVRHRQSLSHTWARCLAFYYQPSLLITDFFPFLCVISVNKHLS